MVPVRIQPAYSVHCGVLFRRTFAREQAGLSYHGRSQEKGHLPHLRVLRSGALHITGRNPLILLKPLL
jgi:hypothetical protein